VFFLTRPTPAQIDAALKGQRDAVLSYSLEGATRDYDCVQVGSGAADFHAAWRLLQNWEMMDLGWLHVVVSEPEVAIVIRHYGFWSVNVSRILYVKETDSSYTVAYGTLPEHAESGEERFTVTLRSDGSVWYEIEAFSQPGHFLALLGYPLVRRLQKRFALDSLEKLKTALAPVPR
jgi:uncharacterized protein (UPF0548 family)